MIRPDETQTISVHSSKSARRHCAMNTSVSVVRRGDAFVLLAAALLSLVGAWIVYPGWLSFDAASHLHQAVSGEFLDLQPPAYAAFWGVLLRVGLPPGALLVLVLATLEFALAGLALAAGLRGPRALVLLLVPAWPPFLVLCGHLWTDVALVALLTLALACGSSVGRGGRLAALLALAAACAVRHNALAAVVVLAWWLAGLEARSWRRRLALSLGALLLVGGSSQLGNRALTVQHMTAWTPTAIWDLAAVSATRGEVLLPPQMIGADMSVGQLAGALDCHTVIHLLTGTRSGINPGIDAPLPEPVLADLRQRWLTLPLRSPRAYLRHRACVAASLFGPQSAEKPETLIFVPEIVERAGNPPMTRNATAVNAWLVAWMRTHRGDLVVAPLLPLLLGLAALVIARRRSLPDDARARIDVLVLSGLAYAASLLPLAPAAEYRYAFWPMLSGSLAFLLALLAPGAAGLPPGSRVASR